MPRVDGIKRVPRQEPWLALQCSRTPDHNETARSGAQAIENGAGEKGLVAWSFRAEIEAEGQEGRPHCVPARTAQREGQSSWQENPGKPEIDPRSRERRPAEDRRCGNG